MEASIPPVATSVIQQSQVQTETALATAEKALRVQEQHGQAAVELVRQVEQLAAQLASGNIDVEI